MNKKQKEDDKKQPERLFEIDLEEILTISASEYCSMMGRSLQSYEPVGVCTHNSYNPLKLIVPKETEVVVDYRIVAVENGGLVGYGTALVLKRGK